MAEPQLSIACQRCGEQMEMKDPGPDQPWRPDQYWVCPRCARHFWTTYPNRPSPPAAAAAPPAPAVPDGSKP